MNLKAGFELCENGSKNAQAEPENGSEFVPHQDKQLITSSVFSCN